MIGSAALLAVPLLAAIGALGGFLWVWSRASNVEQRLRPYFDRLPATAATAARRSIRDQADESLFARLIRMPGGLLDRDTASKHRARLAEAGNPGGISPQSFAGLRFVIAGSLGAAAVLLSQVIGRPLDPRMVVFGLTMIVLGYRLPSLWLARRIQARRAEIEASLPDALDLITVSVEAGLTFEAAMATLAARLPGALSEELGLVMREIGLGKARRQALRDLASRIDVLSLRSFVASIVQADELGSDIGRVLRAQAGSARTRRRHAAQKRALEAPVKIVFPLVFFILPATFVVILGPAAVQILPQVLGQ